MSASTCRTSTTAKPASPSQGPTRAAAWRPARLLAGRAMHRGAPVPSASLAWARAGAGRPADAARRAADEHLQRAVVVAGVGALGQVLEVDRAHDRPALAIHQRDDHLGAAGHVEDDAVGLPPSHG